jgi:S1-C subfamily serine protease
MSTPMLDHPAITNGNPERPTRKPRWRWRVRLARSPVLAVLAAGVLGAGAVTGLLYAVGVAGASTTTTMVRPPAPVRTRGGSQAAFNPAAIYGRAAPGMVAITATGAPSSQTGLPFPFGPPGQQQVTDTGTGFVIDSKGDILTASHVVAGASSITVKFQNGAVRTAQVLGTDSSTDVSVLHVNPSGLTLHPLRLGSAQSLVVGDPLAVIGDPFGYNRSLSTGVVSALDRTIQAPNGFSVAHAIQTDAAINPGNSGGPVLNSGGQVVGIVDQIGTGNSQTASATGVGFAVPIDVVRSELPQLEAGQTVAHAYLGVSTEQAPGNSLGALVAGVAPGSAAATAGLTAGEEITAINGTRVSGPSQLVARIAALKPGDPITLTIKRTGRTVTLTATLGTQPSQAPSG